MKLFPAIDILDGNAVRLFKGRRDEVTVYGDPVERAHAIAAAGGKYLHIVDLNAAFDGTYTNEAVLKEICAVKGLDVQLGGGMRSVERVGYALDTIGAKRAIVGSALVTDERLTEELFSCFGEAIVGGLDVQNGRLAIKGWVNTVDVTPISAALRIKYLGCKDIVFTDISRDGAMTGVNAELTHALQKESGLNIIASGGLSSLADIKKLQELGIYGAILGKAMYSGAVSLEAALEAVGG